MRRGAERASDTAVSPCRNMRQDAPATGRHAAVAVALVVLGVLGLLVGGPAPPSAVAAGDPLRPQQWALDALRAEQVWQRQRAGDVVVAVVDTGVDATHPDLVGQVVPGWDAFSSTTRGMVDPNGHGTGVAGIIGAVVGNGVGIAGFAPDVRILPIRVLDENRIGSITDVERGIRAATSLGADVINLSFGSARPAPGIRTAIAEATLAGAVVIASAGNSYELDGGPRYPAADSEVTSVAAVDRSLRHARFSTAHPTVDVTAPGTDILMLDHGGGYALDAGTSFSAPYVSAAAALLRARYPRATPAQITERLVESVRDLGPKGHDDLHGHGLLQPLAALDWEATSGCRVPGAEPLLRVWDDNRVGTAGAASCTFWPPDGARHAIIARADTYPDALAGTALAARTGSPLLLTPSGGVPTEVRQILAAVGVREATLLGGTQALTSAVEQDLAAIGIDADRIAGGDRYDTAARIARRIGVGADIAVVVTGRNFADAVAAGAYAAGTAPPVLLTAADALPAATRAALVALDPDRIVLVGGPQAVSSRVERELVRIAPVRRVYGDNRYTTSAAVLRDALTRHSPDGPIVLATGAAFPDALAAGAVTARTGGTLLLVDPRNPAAAADVVEDGNWQTAVLLGGTSAMSDAAAAVLRSGLAASTATTATGAPETAGP